MVGLVWKVWFASFDLIGLVWKVCWFGRFDLKSLIGKFGFISVVCLGKIVLVGLILFHKFGWVSLVK